MMMMMSSDGDNDYTKDVSDLMLLTSELGS